MPAVMKPRRVRCFSSASTLRSFSAIAATRAASSSSGVGSTMSGGTSLIGRLPQLHSDHHRAEVVPSGANHLRDMHDEEDDISDREPEMTEARALISAEEPRQPLELHWLVDGHAGEQREKSHDHDRGVRDPLRAVVLPLRRRLAAQMEIVKRDLNGHASHLN